MIQATVRDILLSDPAIAQITHSGIYDQILPRDIKLPCLQLSRVSETIDQFNHAHRTRMQIDCYAETHIDALQLSDRVNGALIDATGVYENEVLITIQHANTLDLSDAENRVSRITQEYTVIWR